MNAKSNGIEFGGQMETTDVIAGRSGKAIGAVWDQVRSHLSVGPFWGQNRAKIPGCFVMFGVLGECQVVALLSH